MSAEYKLDLLVNEDHLQTLEQVATITGSRDPPDVIRRALDHYLALSAVLGGRNIVACISNKPWESSWEPPEDEAHFGEDNIDALLQEQYPARKVPLAVPVTQQLYMLVHRSRKEPETKQGDNALMVALNIYMPLAFYRELQRDVTWIDGDTGKPIEWRHEEWMISREEGGR